MSINLREHAQAAEYGLSTEPQIFLNSLLRDYDPNLSLRRIPENDPAFREGIKENPPRIFGVYEETSTMESKWVFTIPEVSIQNPDAILARIVMGDHTKLSVPERMKRLQAANAAVDAARAKRWEEIRQARHDELAFIASGKRNQLRHKINGEDVVISDGQIRSVRSFV
jgi:hypothetical protein